MIQISRQFIKYSVDDKPKIDRISIYFILEFKKVPILQKGQKQNTTDIRIITTTQR